MSQYQLFKDDENSEDKEFFLPYPNVSSTLWSSYLNTISDIIFLPIKTYWISYEYDMLVKNSKNFTGSNTDSFTLCIDNYEIGNILGRGTFSKVIEVFDINQNMKPFAAKSFSINTLIRNRAARYFKNEVEIITEYDKIWDEIFLNLSINHEHICKLYEVLYSPDKEMLYLIFESLPFSCLYWNEHIQQYLIPLETIESIDTYKSSSRFYLYTEQGAKEIFKQIVDAVHYCHKKGIIHKDIKPENIMLTNKVLRKFTINLEHLNYEINNNSFVESSDFYSLDNNDDHYLWEEALKISHKLKEKKAQFFRQKSLEFSIPLIKIFNKNYYSYNKLLKQDFKPKFVSSKDSKDNPQLMNYISDSCKLTENNLSTLGLNAKLIDFNSATLTNSNSLTIYDSEGTINFSPPECLSLTGESGINGESRDIWSLGCFLYCLLFGSLPFRGKNSFELFLNIQETKLMFPDFRNISSQLKQLLQLMLAIDVNERISIQNIKEHPWINT